MPSREDRRTHIKGLLLAVAGILALSPDSLLIRLIAAGDWTLLFWRGLLLGAGLLIAQSVLFQKPISAAFRSIGKKGIVAAAVQALGTIFFVLAITHTTVANTLIIVGIAPLLAAVLSKFVLGERVDLRTWLAIPAALLGIGITVSAMDGAGTWQGNLSAFCAALCISTHLVIIRSAKHIDMTPSLVVGGFVIAMFVAPLAAPFSLSFHDGLLLCLLGLLVLPVSFGLLVAAPRYITAPEVGLIMLLEMILGPYWVWLVLGEQPVGQVLLGGAVVLATLTVHSWAGLHSRTRVGASSVRPEPADQEPAGGHI